MEQGEVHLYLMACAAEPSGPQQERYLAQLTEDERARHSAFVLERSRREFLATRALVRASLSRYVAVRPEDWRFQADARGRPEVASPAFPFHFNLSNTEGLVVCAVATVREIGVDVENVESRRAPLEVARRYFSEAEATDLERLPVEAQRERFFTYWTLKEAYLKACGMGLALPLDSFTVKLGRAETGEATADRLVLHDATRPQAERDVEAAAWRLARLSPTSAHRLAVALRCGQAPLRLEVQWLEP